MSWAPYRKAVIAGLSAGLASLATALSSGTLTVPEAVGAVLAGLAAGGVTWAVPNRPAPTP